tara:strand:- start:620 stop:925 length:306 start_codon:yes stop_codon:yes gene_type:complete
MRISKKAGLRTLIGLVLAGTVGCTALASRVAKSTPQVVQASSEDRDFMRITKDDIRRAREAVREGSESYDNIIRKYGKSGLAAVIDGVSRSGTEYLGSSYE